MADRNRIVTPYTDPDRFTREEKLLEDHWPDGSPR